MSDSGMNWYDYFFVVRPAGGRQQNYYCIFTVLISGDISESKRHQMGHVAAEQANDNGPHLIRYEDHCVSGSNAAIVRACTSHGDLLPSAVDVSALEQAVDDVMIPV